MSRLWLIPVVVLVGVLAPSVGHAQYAVVSPCGDDCARISIIPAPPTGVPAWVWGTPAPAPVIPPMPLYAPPVYVAPGPTGRGIDPWIPLAVQPPPIANPNDLLGQLLLLQQLGAARPRPQRAPAPRYVAPAPVPAPAAPGENWMSGFIKGVK